LELASEGRRQTRVFLSRRQFSERAPTHTYIYKQSLVRFKRDCSYLYSFNFGFALRLSAIINPKQWAKILMGFVHILGL